MSLSILFVSTEMSPYAKSGGLGDVIGSLPFALRELGVDARVVIPKYRNIRQDHLKDISYVDSFTVNLSWRNQNASIYTFDSDVPTYLIGNDYYFDRDGFYGYGDDHERFSFFSMASLVFLNHIDFKPDVIHFNDWQTGLGPVFLKDIYSRFLYYSNMKSLYTIHNLQYQGIFGRDSISAMGLNDGYCATDKLEFYENISTMKAGLVYADAVSTVSPTYADEIQTGTYGFSMDGVLRSRKNDLSGILNGIDYKKNDPETDPHLFQNYSSETFHLKKVNKTKLQEMLHLPQKDVPMVAIISRLVDQKGIDLVSVAMDEIMSKDLQLVVLGTGDGRYEGLFKNMAWRAPNKISANICFDESLAQKIYAASDMFLMPSLFEPCGLGQLISMRYGSVPIARKTGGLNDTVINYDDNSRTGTGFVFEDYVASGMMWAFNKALDVYYRNRDEWNNIAVSCMKKDFSWEKSARQYIGLYEKMAGAGARLLQS